MQSLSPRTRHDGRLPPGEAAGLRTGAPIPFVRTSALAPFVNFLNTIGAPVDRLLRQARVPPPLLNDTDALLPILSGYRFTELATRQEQMKDLAVVIGQRASAFDLGAYGAALQGASTIYEYLQTGVRLIGAHSSGTRLWLRTEGEALRVSQYLTGPPSLGRCVADVYTLVLTISMLRKFTSSAWSPIEVRLLAGDEALLGDRGVFGDAALITGQRYSSFTVSRSLMQLRVPCRRAGATPGKDTRLAVRQSMPVDFKTSVEQLILSLSIDGYPSIHTAADAAGMSSRSLQRRLGEAGVTYSGLIAASRLRLARVWLSESDMPIAEIAATLGYTEASNFARAFRRQTGISPAAYRHSQPQG